jgi:hypothetical protein
MTWGVWRSASGFGSQIGGVVNVPADVGSSLTYTPTENPAAVTGGALSSPVTFSGVAIGSADADRVVVVSIACKGAANAAGADISALSIGGVGATKAAGGYAGLSAFYNSVWYAVVPTGTTATISATITNGGGWMDGVSIGVGTLTGSATISVASTVTSVAYPAAADNVNDASVTIPTGGVAIFAAMAASTIGSMDVTWSGATNDYEETFVSTGNNIQANFAHNDTVGTATETHTVTNTNGDSGWVAAVFEP